MMSEAAAAMTAAIVDDDEKKKEKKKKKKKEEKVAAPVSARPVTLRARMTNFLRNQPVWLILAVASGSCAAFNGVFAKL